MEEYNVQPLKLSFDFLDHYYPVQLYIRSTRYLSFQLFTLLRKLSYVGDQLPRKSSIHFRVNNLPIADRGASTRGVNIASARYSGIGMKFDSVVLNILRTTIIYVFDVD